MAETQDSLQIQREEGKVEDNRVKAQSEFTVADVISALESYIATSKEDTTVKIALTSHTPKVQGFVITLEVGFITLNVQVYTESENGEEKRRLFTAKDKFDHFVEINPAVSELKALFGLEIE